MLKLSFHQTKAEIMVRAAATLLFNALIRAGCSLVPLSDLAENAQYGFTASATSAPVGPKFVRITDLQDANIDWDAVPYCDCNDPPKYLLEPYDLLFARTGATTGKTHLVGRCPRAVFASYLIRLRPKPTALAEYLYCFFQSDNYWSQISDSKEGSAQPNVNGRKLMNIAIPLVGSNLQSAVRGFLKALRDRQEGLAVPLPELPSPLDEQRRIVARIEEVAARAEEARFLRLRAAKEVEQLKRSGTDRFFSHLNGTRLTRIDETCEVRGGIQKSSGRTPGANPRRYITVAHVQRNSIYVGDPRYFEVSDEELERWRLLPGDVLVIEGNGSSEQIGRAALFRGEIEDCVHQNHVIRIRPNPDKLLPEYLNIYLNSSIGRGQMLERSRTTSGLFNLSVGRIKELEIPVPSLAEQCRGVAEVGNLDSIIGPLVRLQSETAAELDVLLPSILSKAFRGELL